MTAIDDPDAGAQELAALLRSRHPLPLRRIAGFDAVAALDRAGRYRDAYGLAIETHAATTPPRPIEDWTAPMEEQFRLLDARASDPGTVPAARVPRVEGVAFIVAMPRSGTTLLEKMLDRHPAIGGIGEHDGIDEVARLLRAVPGWPRAPGAVPATTLAEAQRRYLAGAAELRRPGATIALDKSLFAFRALPELAAALPGAPAIHVVRDPRDLATSQFLSYFNPLSYAWTRSLDLIRAFIALERAYVPRALAVLGIPHVRIVYEDLVEDPTAQAARVLALLGLGMDERVLRPEEGERSAFTLSQAQVRRPINRNSVGRWRNYAFAFDGRWDELAAAHEAMRATPG